MLIYALDSPEIVLTVDSTRFIVITLPVTLDTVFRYDEVFITFHDHDKAKYTLFRSDFIIYALRVLYCSLESLLEGKRKLHESITKDIGYYWNKELWGNDKHLIQKKNRDGKLYWVGWDYCWWSGFGIESWLYEKDNKIYLQVTPTYQWPSREQKKQGYQTYREFLKNYKPYVVTTIDWQVAQDWYKKAGELLEIVEANDAKHRDILDTMPVFRQIDKSPEESETIV